jgi:hypothetical protein
LGGCCICEHFGIKKKGPAKTAWMCELKNCWEFLDQRRWSCDTITCENKLKKKKITVSTKRNFSSETRKINIVKMISKNHMIIVLIVFIEISCSGSHIATAASAKASSGSYGWIVFFVWLIAFDSFVLHVWK